MGSIGPLPGLYRSEEADVVLVAQLSKKTVGVKIKHAIAAGGVACNPGEIVGLREDVAENVVRRGYGEYVSRPVPVPSAPVKVESSTGPARDDKQVKERVVKG